MREVWIICDKVVAFSYEDRGPAYPLAMKCQPLFSVWIRFQASQFSWLLASLLTVMCFLTFCGFLFWPRQNAKSLYIIIYETYNIRQFIESFEV